MGQAQPAAPPPAPASPPGAPGAAPPPPPVPGAYAPPPPMVQTPQSRRTTYAIQRIDIVSALKIGTVLYAILGFFIALLFMAFAGLMSGVMRASGMPMGAMFGAGAAALILYPILYAILGAIGTLIFTALYNWLAGAMGGVQVDLE